MPIIHRSHTFSFERKAPNADLDGNPAYCHGASLVSTNVDESSRLIFRVSNARMFYFRTITADYILKAMSD